MKLRKKCSKCGKTKSFLDFYAGSGATCKACVIERALKYRADNIDRVRAYDRKRGQTDKHRKRVREFTQKYVQTAVGREKRSNASKAWAERNQLARAAHVILGNAVRNGRVIKLKTCQECGKRKPLHGHHHDYTKPLDVRWLCNPCHRLEHQQEHRQ